MSHVTDSRDFTIKLVKYPDIKIVRLVYPESARAGEAITITWRVRNDGGDTAITQFIRLVDRDTGEELKKQYFRLEPGQETGGNWGLTMPNRDWRLRVEAGYETAYGRYPTETRELEIPIAEVKPEVLIASLIPIAVIGGVIGLNEVGKVMK